MLVDLRPKKLTGKVAEEALGEGRHHRQQEHDPLGPGEAHRHLRHPRRHAGAHHPRHGRPGDGAWWPALIGRVLDAPADEAVLARVRGEVRDLCAHFPMYADRQ